jgi:alanyl-tRNA synthetase
MIRGVAIKKGETAKVSIDDDARKRVMANHTATHLLQAALRKVLGDHVRQTGSLVDDAHLRFDFTHMKKMEPREVARVEEIVNDGIRKAIHVKKDIMSLEEAKRDGATALFGEKYEDRVRVVSIGDLSKELCGGTHVNNTRDIGAFRITSESSIASGVRRIEALTGKEAEEWITKKAAEENARMKAESDKDAAKKAMQARTREELSNIDKFISRSKAKGGSRIIVENINGVDMDCLRALSDAIRSKEKSAAIVLATVAEEKASFIVSVTEDLVARGVKAGDIAREMAGMIEGSGGGKPSFAQGGGKAPQRLGDALGKIGEYLGGKI